MSRKLVKSGSNALAANNASEVLASFVENIVRKQREEYEMINEGFDNEDDRLEDWMKIDNGKFYIGDIENPHYLGEKIRVIVPTVVSFHCIWGKKGTEEVGKLVTKGETLEEAEEELVRFLEEHPEKQGDYKFSDIKKRGLATIILEDSVVEGDPEILIHDMPITSYNTFRDLKKALYKGRTGVEELPKKIGPKQIIIEMSVKTFTNDDNERYSVAVFKPVKLLDPSEYEQQEEAGEMQEAEVTE